MILWLLVGLAIGFVLGVLATYLLGVIILLTRGLPPPTQAPIARIKQPDGGWR